MTRKAAVQTEVYAGKLAPSALFSVLGMGLIGLVGLLLVIQMIWLIFHGGITIWAALLLVAAGLLLVLFAGLQLRSVVSAASASYTVTPTALVITRRFGVRQESLPWATFTRVSRETRPSLRPPGIILETTDRRIMIHGLTLAAPRMQMLYEAIRARVPARARI
jgi:hypothetical protein